MIVAGFPVSLRELHHLTWWWLRFLLLGTDKRASAARFNFLYFSYSPDFDCLVLSLRTLRNAILDELLGQVFLAEDQKAPFSPSQLTTLRSIVPQLRVIPVRDFEWGSPSSTHAELQIFKMACEHLTDACDLLVKVDSDVLFLRNEKWARILRSGAEAVGDGHFLQHRYAQGGLYMMRRHLVQHVFADTTVTDLEVIAREIDSVGEDMAISQLLADSGKPFFFTRMMLFPDEYGPLPSLRSAVRREFLALHCHKDKARMPALIARFDLMGEQGALH